MHGNNVSYYQLYSKYCIYFISKYCGEKWKFAIYKTQNLISNEISYITKRTTSNLMFSLKEKHLEYMLSIIAMSVTHIYITKYIFFSKYCDAPLVLLL